MTRLAVFDSPRSSGFSPHWRRKRGGYPPFHTGIVRPVFLLFSGFLIALASYGYDASGGFTSGIVGALGGSSADQDLAGRGVGAVATALLGGPKAKMGKLPCVTKTALPELRISASKYPELAKNILNAQKAGHPVENGVKSEWRLVNS